MKQPGTTTLFHCSDLHFGHPAVPEQFEAIEALIDELQYDVVAISGDVSQRARSGEFQRARAFIQRASRVSHTIIVPGNHDVAWWRSPLGFGDSDALLEKYRRYISPDPEPVLRIAGATIVGLNTAQGVLRQTLTWNVRDISIIGHLRRSQLERARAEFERSRTSDARIIVMHHNPVKGELSQRHGLKNTQRVLGAFAEMGVELVLCGHDHQEAVHYIEHTKRGTVISTAGTISNRSRGARPSSVNAIRITEDGIDVSTFVWSEKDVNFVAGPSKWFSRAAEAAERAAEQELRERERVTAWAGGERRGTQQRAEGHYVGARSEASASTAAQGGGGGAEPDGGDASK